jgi:hypothetical protein
MHLDSSLTEPRRSTGGKRVRIVYGVDDLGDTGCYQRLRAGTRLSRVRTRLETDHRRPASGGLARYGQCNHFRMRAAGRSRGTFPGQCAVGIEDDGPHRRVGTGVPTDQFTLREGTVHRGVLCVADLHCSS